MVPPSVSESMSMTAVFLSVRACCAGRLSLLIMLMQAAVIMLGFKHLMLDHRMMMDAMRCGLSGVDVDMKACSFRLTVQRKEGYASNNGEFSNVFFHGLCVFVSAGASCPLHLVSAAEINFYLKISTFFKKAKFRPRTTKDARPDNDN